MKLRPWFLLAAIAAAGCGGYDAPSEVTYGQLVYTQPAPTPGGQPSDLFKPLNSYYLEPTMDVWEDGASQGTQLVPSSTVSAITAQMTSLGYTQQTTPPPAGPAGIPNADVGLRLTSFKTNYTYYTGGGYCYYWWYYYCYPGWAYAGTYTTGTVLVSMIDLRNAGTTPQPGRALWVSVLYAVLGTSGLENAPQLNTALGRAFDQSPYLDTH